MQPVIAYLDPATGTLILSAIVGGFAAAAMFVKRYWYKFKGVFVKNSSTDVATPDAGLGDVVLEDE